MSKPWKFTQAQIGQNIEVPRRSVSSGHICLFGNFLYSSSRTQKTIALSYAEAEIYAGVSACCDGKLMQACVQLLLEDGVKVEFTLNLDNSAAKAFFFRSGVGRIRHISVRILWLQREVKLGMVTPSTVPHVTTLQTSGARG